jgi:hypothetical protein
VTDATRGSAALHAAAEATRATAKWILGTLGALAAVLLVGIKLTDIHNADTTVRTLGAVAGAAIALVAVSRAIFSTARVLAPAQTEDKHGRPRSAFSDPRLQTLVESDRTLLGGFSSLSSLRDDYTSALEALREAQQNYQDGDRASRLRLLRAQRALRALDPVVQFLRDLSIFEEVRARYERATRDLGVATFAVIAGALLFVASTST